MTPFLLSQILATIAMIFDLSSFQFKEKKKMMLCNTTAALLLAIHCSLLNEVSGAFVLIISGLRFFTSIYTTNKVYRDLFVIAYLLSFGVTFSSLTALLPTIAAINSTYACFLKNDQSLRLRMMFTTLLFITYFIIIKSPVACMLEIGFLTSNIVGYLRYYKFTLPKN